MSSDSGILTQETHWSINQCRWSGKRMVGKSLRAVEKVFDDLNTEGRTVGLNINESKQIN